MQELLSKRKIYLSKYAKKKGLNYFPYQESMIRDICNSNSTFIYNASEPGCGKTAITYGVAHNLGVTSMLVVCPASIRINWLRESVWAGPNLQDGLAILSSKDLDHIKSRCRWQKGMHPSLVIVSHDMLTSSQYVLKHVLDVSWDMIVFDEADMCANITAKRTKNMMELCTRTQMVHFLSGTPLRNSSADMYPHLHVIYKNLEGASARNLKLTGTHETYTNNFTYKHNSMHGISYRGVRNREDFEKLVKVDSHSFFRVLKSEVNKDLPEKTYNTVEISLKLSNGKDFESSAAVTRFIQAYSTAKGKEQGISKEVASLRAKLGEAKATHPETIEFIKTLLNAGRSVVVFGHHTRVLDILMHNLKEYIAVRLDGKTTPSNKQRAIDTFQSGEAKVFIGNLKAASVGITLTRSSDVVFVETDYVPATMTQAFDRIHRIGQKDGATAHYIISNHKFDRDIIKTMIDKQKSFDKVGL